MNAQFKAVKVTNYHGGTSAKVEWRLVRIRDGRDCGTYKTLREAKEWSHTLAD